jgi:DNA-binding response OmpR family regulator
MMAHFHYRLLLVDDEPSIRDLFQTSLSAKGYEVRVAKDGFDALAQMGGALPDLILTDLKMPNMSGFEFLSVVRRRFPQIPTVAISGEFHPPVEPLGVIADSFFVKPFKFEELLAKITELLRDSPPRAAIKKDRAPVWVPRNGRILRNHLHRLPAFLLNTGREKCPNPSRASHAGVHFLQRAGSVYC